MNAHSMIFAGILDYVERFSTVNFAINTIYYVITFLVSLVVYVITACVLQTVAQRRGLPKPWMAWVPVGQLWLLGSISDHYQQTTRYNITYNRRTLLWLQIVTIILLMLVMLLAIDTVSCYQLMDNGVLSHIGAQHRILYNLKGIVVLSLLLLVASGLTAGFQYVALYDLYRSCDPYNSVVYLLLSIFVSIAMPILMLVVYDKDDGVPQQTPLQQVQKKIMKKSMMITMNKIRRGQK